jgi:capsule assembly protein Wzi
MTQNRLKCWTQKDKDLLMADKVANSDEKSVDAFDGRPSYDEPAEKGAGQERVEELNRGFFYFNDHDVDGYADSGDLIGNWIVRQQEGGQVGTNYWFGTCNHLQFKFQRQKLSRQHLHGGRTLMDAGGRGHYRARSNLRTFGICAKWTVAIPQNSAKRSKKCDGYGGNPDLSEKTIPAL